MKTRNKKGFTIVELVIVIAVIGILTAILVPVFINLTNKANRASDDSLVKNLNTAMAMEEGEGKTNNTYHDAIQYLDNYGYKLANLATKAGNDLLWNSKTNRFLLNEESEYVADKNATGAKDVDYWTIKDNIPGGNTFSIYAGLGWNEANPVVVDGIGFDAGDHAITSISYNGASQNVVIRTNGGTLTIDAQNDEVTHYGQSDYVDIIAVKSSSYEERGTTSLIKVAKGNVALNSESTVGEIHFAKTGDEFTDIKVTLENGAKLPDLSRDPVGTSSLDNVLICEVVTSGTSEFYWLNAKGTIEDGEVLVSSTKTGEKSAATAENSTAVAIANAKTGTDQASDPGATVKAAEEMTPEEVTEATASGATKTFAEIDSKEKLIEFRNAWNNGKLTSGTFKLTSNIDISGEDWLPIGTWEYPFCGIIDGNNKTINGLTKTRLSEEDIYSTGSTTQYMGVVFGLFGITGGSDLEIKNLTLNNVNISLPVGAQVSAVIGYAPNNGDFTSSSKGGVYWSTIETEGKKVLPENYGKDDIALTNVIVNGSITAKQHVGGLIGKAYNTGELEVTNCTNNAIISADNSCAGIGGYVNGQSSVTFDGCANNGNISANSAFAGIVNSSNTFALTVRNSSNSGTLEWLGSTYNVMSWNSSADNADSWNFIANGVAQNAKTLENNTNTGKFVKGNIELLKAPTKGLFGYDFTDSNGHTLTLNLRNHNFTLKIDEDTTYSGVWAIGSNARNAGSFMMGAKDNWNVLYAEVENVKTSEAFVLTDANSTFGNYNLSFNITGDDLALLKAIIALDGDASNDSWNLSL